MRGELGLKERRNGVWPGRVVADAKVEIVPVPAAVQVGNVIEAVVGRRRLEIHRLQLLVDEPARFRFHVSLERGRYL